MDILGQLEERLGLKRIDFSSELGTEMSLTSSVPNVETSNEIKEIDYKDIKNVDFVKVSNTIGVPISNLKQLFRSVVNAMDMYSLSEGQTSCCEQILKGLVGNSLRREEFNELIRLLHS